jgi:cell division control protein 6
MGLSRHGVFKSRRVLLHDYTPSRLPHRERELKELKSYFDPVLGEDVNVKVHVHGSIGTGKTVLCRRLGSYLEVEAAKKRKKLKYVHVNLAYTPKPYHVMTKLLDQVSFVESSRSGLSPEEMLAIVARNLSQLDYKLVLTLDEVDTYISERRDPSILYMLPRVHELYPDAACRISIIYVSRSLDWMRKLDNATLDTLGRVSAVHLSEYGLAEVRDIVGYRAAEAFQHGAVSEDVTDFIARTSVDYGGVRYALELLLEAGGQAELAHATVVKAEHVRRAHALIPKGVNGAYYPGELSLHKQLLLRGIINALQARTEPYLSLDDTFSAYQIACEEYEREAEDKQSIQTHLEDLKIHGYVLLVKGDDGILVGMEFPLERLAKALKESLKQALQSSEKH